MKPLEPKQQRFVEEYLIDLNATQAAERAGYSKKTAYSQGQRLLKNVEVQRAISKGQEKIRNRNGDLAQRVIEELKIIGFSDLKNHIKIDDYGSIVAKPFEEMPEDASRALEVCEEVRTIKEDPGNDKKKGETTILNSRIRFKMHSKTAALESLCKHLGLYEKDNQQKPSIPDTLTVKVVMVRADDSGNGNGNGNGKGHEAK